MRSKSAIHWLCRCVVCSAATSKIYHFQTLYSYGNFTLDFAPECSSWWRACWGVRLDWQFQGNVSGACQCWGWIQNKSEGTDVCVLCKCILMWEGAEVGIWIWVEYAYLVICSRPCRMAYWGAPSSSSVAIDSSQIFFRPIRLDIAYGVRSDEEKEKVWAGVWRVWDLLHSAFQGTRLIWISPDEQISLSHSYALHYFTPPPVWVSFQEWWRGDAAQASWEGLLQGVLVDW